MNEYQGLEKEIERLEGRLGDRELALPAHSIRPSQLLVIEELEEAIKGKKRELAACVANGRWQSSNCREDRLCRKYFSPHRWGR